jgi:hypothetical protein
LISSQARDIIRGGEIWFALRTGVARDAADFHQRMIR